MCTGECVRLSSSCMIDLKTLISSFCLVVVVLAHVPWLRASQVSSVLLCICALHFPCTGNIYVGGMCVCVGGKVCIT